MIEAYADVMLAINRCLSMLSSRASEFFFGKNRVYIWIGICLFAGFLTLFMDHPVLFNSLHFAWFYNPYEGYNVRVETPTVVSEFPLAIQIFLLQRNG